MRSPEPANDQCFPGSADEQLPTCRDAEEGAHQCPEPDSDDADDSPRKSGVEGPVDEGESSETGDDEEGVNPTVTPRDSSGSKVGGFRRVMTSDFNSKLELKSQKMIVKCQS